jgi:hypothetical protein
MRKISQRTRNSVLRDFQAEASDYELSVIEELALRIGWLWNCENDEDRTHWTNPGYAKKCEECGKARPKK